MAAQSSEYEEPSVEEKPERKSLASEVLDIIREVRIRRERLEERPFPFIDILEGESKNGINDEQTK